MAAALGRCQAVGKGRAGSRQGHSQPDLSFVTPAQDVELIKEWPGRVRHCYSLMVTTAVCTVLVCML